MDFLEFIVYQESNLRNKTRDCSIKGSTNNITATIQSLIEEFEYVVFESFVLDYRDLCILTAAFATLVLSGLQIYWRQQASWHSKPNCLPQIEGFWLTKRPSTDTLMKQIELNEHNSMSRLVITKSTFWHFQPIRFCTAWNKVETLITKYLMRSRKF